MEGIYVRLRASIEAEVQVRGRRLPSNNVDVREARLAVSLVELRYTEGSENDLVEADAFTVVARMYIKVINDRASPVPFLSRHGRRLPDSVAEGKLRRLGERPLARAAAMSELFHMRSRLEQDSSDRVRSFLS